MLASECSGTSIISLAGLRGIGGCRVLEREILHVLVHRAVWLVSGSSVGRILGAGPLRVTLPAAYATRSVGLLSAVREHVIRTAAAETSAL